MAYSSDHLWRVEGPTRALNMSRSLGDDDIGSISAEPDITQYDASKYFTKGYEVCVVTGCDGLLERSSRENYRQLFEAHQKASHGNNFAQECVKNALLNLSSDNITALSATFADGLPQEGVLMCVFDGHGGKQASQTCKNTMLRLAQKNKIDAHLLKTEGTHQHRAFLDLINQKNESPANSQINPEAAEKQLYKI